MKRREFMALIGGMAAVWPFSARGQRRDTYRIGYLAFSPRENNTHMRLFASRLRELGLVEGKNLEIIYRSAEGRPEQLPQLAQELVQLKPDVLVAGFGTLTAKAAKEATTTIPVVFLVVGDPIGAGLITNLARPGGNVTGMSSQIKDLGGKRLEIIRELIPTVKQIGVVLNPQTPLTSLSLGEIRSSSLAHQIDIKEFHVMSAQQADGQFEVIKSNGIEAIIVLEDPLIFSLQSQLVELSINHRIPALFAERSFVTVGGLVGFGPNRTAIFRRAADYVERVLKGTPPGILPVEQPTVFELLVNLKTARAIGVDVPVSLLARADEVIE